MRPGAWPVNWTPASVRRSASYGEEISFSFAKIEWD